MRKKQTLYEHQMGPTAASGNRRNADAGKAKRRKPAANLQTLSPACINLNGAFPTMKRGEQTIGVASYLHLREREPTITVVPPDGQGRDQRIGGESQPNERVTAAKVNTTPGQTKPPRESAIARL